MCKVTGILCVNPSRVNVCVCVCVCVGDVGPLRVRKLALYFTTQEIIYSLRQH